MSRADDACHLCLGWVRHRRGRPAHHAFRMSLFYALLDVERAAAPLDGTAGCGWRRPAWTRFHRRDYLAGPTNLAEAARQRARELGCDDCGGRVLLLTQLRSGGHCFNPVSFYYLHGADGRCSAVLAEITNTPWGERHCYLVPRNAEGRLQRRFPKVFHVSPFNGMQQIYDWRFSEPGRHLVVHMVNEEDGSPLFDATLSLQRRPWRATSVLGCQMRWPWLSLLTLLRIHYEAARLWWKGVPFHAHPPRHRACA
jgi:hypothetical protein